VPKNSGNKNIPHETLNVKSRLPEFSLEAFFLEKPRSAKQKGVKT
jgi:hypothetical protein